MTQKRRKRKKKMKGKLEKKADKMVCKVQVEKDSRAQDIQWYSNTPFRIWMLFYLL